MSISLAESQLSSRSWPGSILSYWGKAKPVETGPDFHPLAFHSLDVAAVAWAYLDQTPRMLGWFAAAFGLAPDETKRVLSFLIAIHDLGKFADNFQWKCPEVAQRLGSTSEAARSSAHHDEVALMLWREKQQDFLELLGKYCPDLRPQRIEELLTASFGHHGQPPSDRGNLSDAMFMRSQQSALEFTVLCAELLLAKGCSFAVSSAKNKQITWSLAGLTMLCDWIGSNTDWFRYQPASEFPNVDSYWQYAVDCAACAVDRSGVVSQSVRAFGGAHQLLGSLASRALRPAQKQAEVQPLDTGPQLLVLEDATGSGKTEAALILCARLMAMGSADGFYFALPTQATADQMFSRVAILMRAMFEEPNLVSYVLSHSARDQHPWFQAMREKKLAPDAILGEADTASFTVSAWLARGSKRSLLAQLGAGTVDQCLLAVLRTPHQAMRLFGLQRKVLIVDEVHSYDAYMTETLATLLRAHAALGGSAILLSATLSARTRDELISAFSSGVASEDREIRLPAPAPYPLLTHLRADQTPDLRPLGTSPLSCRRIAVDYVCDLSDVRQRIEQWLARGKAVVWVRNTVADAVEAYEYFRERMGERCTLFHSRYALVDRLRIQSRVLDDLGRRSNAITRSCRLIIATQVLSQSLDLDADEMISDHAPIDELLQRQGRLRRHVRDAGGGTIDSESTADDARGDVRLVVFGPRIDRPPESNWYRRFSRGAAYVYHDHGRLWLAAHAIAEGMDLPIDFRRLVDRVYDSDADIPASLQRSSDQADGAKTGHQQTAASAVIGFRQGYVSTGDWSDQERIGTRLGDSIEAVLAKIDGQTVVPWAKGDDAWAMSAIRIPHHWNGGQALVIGDAQLARAIDDLRVQTPALKYRWILPLVTDGTEWKSAPALSMRLRYSAETGLMRNK